jgi:outer membrane protein assembly factor BamB
MNSKIFFGLLSVLFFAAFACTNKEVTPRDWPQFKKDNFRSGTSTIELNIENLKLDWTYTAAQEPVPAWYGPAKEDAYARSGPLPSMRDYDLAYYPIVVGNDLYYASSADDAIHCINTKNGKEKWIYTTGGPIRIAPVFHKGNLYFGSDDGFVYCINARNAKLKWKYCPVPKQDRWILNNGRLISFWPIRTGVLVEDNKVYFGASLLPWKKTYFCAINIETGKPDEEFCYVKEMENMTLEGAMASSGSMLIQPQGRIAPVFFDKTNGENKGSLPGTGGCFVLVTPEKHIIHSQTPRYKSMQEYVSDKQPEYMTFKGGKEMVIKGDTSFVLTDKTLSAYNRKSKKLLWLRRSYQAHRIIRNENALFVGATDTVYAVSFENGLPLWKGQVEGTVYAMSIADDALFVSTNEGKINCFRAGSKSNTLYAQNRKKAAVIEERHDKKRNSKIDKKLILQSGPFLKALSADSLELTFETEETKLKLEWKTPGYEAFKVNLNPKRKHSILLPVRKDFIYTCKLTNDNKQAYQFEYDNFFNYKKKALGFTKYDDENERVKSEIKEKLSNVDIHSGIAVVLGLKNKQFPVDLARYSNFNVIVLDDDDDDVEDVRDNWQEAGIYGEKLSIRKIENLNSLPIASELANLVYLNTKQQIKCDEVIKLIAPKGVAVVEAADDDWLKDSNLDWQVDYSKKGKRIMLKKLPFEVAGDWTHQYARADNSAFGGESFWGTSTTNDFEIQWMGRPGPRFQTDRSGRKPSPLAINGKMFVQGNERVIATDVYNGNILWSADFPGFKRMNIHRDCSNWAAGSNCLFMAIGKNLVKVDQKTGDIISVIPIGKQAHDWGYIAVINDKIIGTSIPKNSTYTNFHGGGAAGWYDAKTGANTHKVLSDEIFMKDQTGIDNLWRYTPTGYIINASITQWQDRLYFIESSIDNLTDLGRGGDDIFKNTSLVALDLNTGKQAWKKRVKHMPGISMYSMAAGTGKLVVVSSHDWKYKIYCYDSNSGKLIWEKEQKWFQSHHGSHLSRPAIVKNRLIVKPVIYHLNTGEQQEVNVPKSGHGCATYALTEQSVFYRGGSVTQFNFDTREFSRWERLRPDCWLSTIPAQGMVLSPEAGGGCSCGNWLETSMVMAPVSRAPITIHANSGNKPDYKEETYHKYTQAYHAGEFVDSVQVSVAVKFGVNGVVRYTIDGSEPSEKSKRYTKPFVLNQSAEVKAAIFIEKQGRIRRFARSAYFHKLQKKPDEGKEM